MCSVCWNRMILMLAGMRHRSHFYRCKSFISILNYSVETVKMRPEPRDLRQSPNTPPEYRLHSATPRPSRRRFFARSNRQSYEKYVRRHCRLIALPFVRRAPCKDGIFNTTLSLNTTFTTNGARPWPGVGDRQSWHKMNGTTKLPPPSPTRPTILLANVLKAKKELCVDDTGMSD